MESNKSSNTGVYWVVGISVVGISVYLVAKKYYDEKIKTNPTFSVLSWWSNSTKK